MIDGAPPACRWYRHLSSERRCSGQLLLDLTFTQVLRVRMTTTEPAVGATVVTLQDLVLALVSFRRGGSSHQLKANESNPDYPPDAEVPPPGAYSAGAPTNAHGRSGRRVRSLGGRGTAQLIEQCSRARSC